MTSDFSEKPDPRKAILKTIIHPKTNEIIDHGLVLWFPGKSFQVC